MYRLVILAALVGCTHPPPVATAADAARANVPLPELARGRAILVKKCSACHATPVPRDKPAAEWPKWIADMTDRAHLVGDEAHAIEQYMLAMAPPGTQP